MLEPVLHNYAFGLECTKLLVDDVPDDQMSRQPAGIVNHPAWTLGHFVYASNFAAVLLGLESTAPRAWTKLFGKGTTPLEDRSKYPTKDELIAALDRQHARVAEALANADPALFGQPMPNDEFREIMPTIGDGLGYLLVAHEANHLGQLSAWRRAMGMPPVLE